MTTHNTPGVPRRGASAVEFAVALPLLVALIFAAVEFGRALMVQHMLQEASQAGCRLYCVNDLTQQDAQDMIDTAMSTSGITGYNVTFDPPTKAEIDEHMEPVTVKIDVDYSEVSWISAWFISDAVLAARATMPADLNELFEDETTTDP